jgi:hypothetical protein
MLGQRGALMRTMERETSMRMHTAFGLAVIVASSLAAPAFAAGMKSDDAMMMTSHKMMLKPGEAMVVMPNGESMMVSGGKADPAMMAAATPMPDCMIMMMGADHMMHMMSNMKMADGKTACDEMSMMKK